MGHCNMLLAVAGLDKNAITERTGKLASGELSCFTPAEQAAFTFAHKLSKKATISAQDFQELTSHFGQERALDVVWWVCHCHYMTCVADAFQLPLEGTNVFDGFLAAQGDGKEP
jgi:hypothetical protein